MSSALALLELPSSSVDLVVHSGKVTVSWGLEVTVAHSGTDGSHVVSSVVSSGVRVGLLVVEVVVDVAQGGIVIGPA